MYFLQPENVGLWL